MVKGNMTLFLILLAAWSYNVVQDFSKHSTMWTILDAAFIGWTLWNLFHFYQVRKSKREHPSNFKG